jgi:tRNA A-37 threonylcarbamoyl transferase component Bud32
MSDKNKIERAGVEIDIYERALEMLEKDGVEKVSMEYIKGLIADMKRVLELEDK